MPQVIVLNPNGSRTTVFIPDRIAAPVLTNPTTIAETVVLRGSLPANFLEVGMSLLAKANMMSAGTGTVTWRMRIGAAGTTADTLVATLTTSAAQVANARGTVAFSVFASATTTLSSSGFAIMSGLVLGTVTGAIVNATVVPTGVVFISITAQISVAAANVITGGGLFLDA